MVVGADLCRCSMGVLASFGMVGSTLPRRIKVDATFRRARLRPDKFGVLRCSVMSHLKDSSALHDGFRRQLQILQVSLALFPCIWRALLRKLFCAEHEGCRVLVQLALP